MMTENEKRSTAAIFLDGIRSVGTITGSMLGGTSGAAVKAIGGLAGVIANQVRIGRLDRSEWISMIVSYKDVDDLDTEEADARILKALERARNV